MFKAIETQISTRIENYFTIERAAVIRSARIAKAVQSLRNGKARALAWALIRHTLNPNTLA